MCTILIAENSVLPVGVGLSTKNTVEKTTDLLTQLTFTNSLSGINILQRRKSTLQYLQVLILLLLVQFKRIQYKVFAFKIKYF